MSEKKIVSIVDYLNEIGEDSSFESRKARYLALWPNDAYSGSAQQNTKLLRSLIESKKKAIVPFPSSGTGSCALFYNDPEISKKLTEAFRANAISACIVTGVNVEAAAIREQLQKTYLVTNPANGEYFTAEEHKSIHDKAYEAAGCAGTSAPEWGWILVNNQEFWDWAIGAGIAIFGECNP